MKTFVIVALLAAQVGLVEAPAQASSLMVEDRQQQSRMGAFAGARVRIALGDDRRERVRAGVALSPTVHRLASGTSRMQIGEGLAYEFSERRAPAVSLAGYRMDGAQGVPGGHRQGVSTLGWVAIGAGVVVLAGVGVLGWLVHEANENTE